MLDSPLLRKAGLAAALGGTVYASFLMPDDAQDYQPAPLPAPVRAGAQAQLATIAAPAGPIAFEDEDEGGEASDPFAPRNWLPPAPPAPAVPARTVAALQPVATITLPEGPPPVPFQFAGRMNDGDDHVVYLARGDRALVARTGEVLENIYKVVSIDASQIEFVHIPTGQKQLLSLPAQEN
jgi:hypothetical protein